MRQVGILAAAGIIALQEQASRLADDHARAKKIALELAKIPGIIIKPDEVDINMVFFAWPPAKEASIAAKVVEVFKKHKIVISHRGGGLFRFITHYWIGDTEAEAILTASREAFALGQTS